MSKESSILLVTAEKSNFGEISHSSIIESSLHRTSAPLPILPAEICQLEVGLLWELTTSQHSGGNTSPSKPSSKGIVVIGTQSFLVLNATGPPHSLVSPSPQLA